MLSSPIVSSSRPAPAGADRPPPYSAVPPQAICDPNLLFGLAGFGEPPQARFAEAMGNALRRKPCRLGGFLHEFRQSLPRHRAAILAADQVQPPRWISGERLLEFTDERQIEL